MSRDRRDLDRALSSDGQDVVLRRTTGATQQIHFDVTCRAFVRGYDPDPLSGRIDQGMTKIIMSPSEIIAAGWPGAQPVGLNPRVDDVRVPRKGDKVFIAGEQRTIEARTPIYVGGELVRIELMVKG